MKKTVIIILVLLFHAPQGYTNSKTVSLATFNWEPFVGENLADKGVTSKIVEEAFRRSDYDVNLKFIPWSIILTNLKTRQYDAGYPAQYGEESPKDYIFSEPIMERKIGFFKKKAREITYNKLSDLKSLKVGIVQSYVYSPEFENAVYIEKKEAQNDRKNLQKLLKNKIDLVLIDKTVAENIINKYMSSSERESIEFMPRPLEVKTLHLIVSLEHNHARELIDNFNAGLEIIKKDGTYKRILQEYGFDE